VTVIGIIGSKSAGPRTMRMSASLGCASRGEMHEDARTKSCCRSARVQNLEMCNAWPSRDAIPSLLSLVIVTFEAGLFGHFASYATG
jgi:hypothetical protein